jgi:hypothetical protein
VLVAEGAGVVVTDRRTTVTAGPGCRTVSGSQVRCDQQFLAGALVLVEAGERDDAVDAAALGVPCASTAVRAATCARLGAERLARRRRREDQLAGGAETTCSSMQVRAARNPGATPSTVGPGETRSTTPRARRR